MKIALRYFACSILKSSTMNENPEPSSNIDSLVKMNEQVLPSTRVKSRKKDVTAYPVNPFWKPLEVEIGRKRVTIAGNMVMKADTGETTHLAGIHRIEEVDEDQFVKLYTRNMHVFFDLSPGSQKLLQCVLSIVQKRPRCQGIYLEWLDMEDYATKVGFKYSRSTYHRALHEMIEKGFLAESERSNYFWINPHLFFNGDRMVLVTEYRKKHEKLKVPPSPPEADPRQIPMFPKE